MLNINELDWERVNAWHDGELAGEEATRFEARLKVEPELQKALLCVQKTSSALAGLRPEAAVPKAANQNDRFKSVLAGASMAAAVLIGAFFVMKMDRPDDLVSVHASFLQNQYKWDAPLTSNVSVQTGHLPDLNGARLVLADVRDEGGATTVHYIGQNGCRVTFFDRETGLELGAVGNVLVAEWSAANRFYAVIADGMDNDRFQAIADYLKHITKLNEKWETANAMKRATETAAPCA